MIFQCWIIIVVKYEKVQVGKFVGHVTKTSAVTWHWSLILKSDIKHINSGKFINFIIFFMLSQEAHNFKSLNRSPIKMWYIITNSIFIAINYLAYFLNLIKKRGGGEVFGVQCSGTPSFWTIDAFEWRYIYIYIWMDSQLPFILGWHPFLMDGSATVIWE